MSNIDELIENTNLNNMLQFETQIFLDIIHQDGLVVAAKGLSLDTVIINLLKVYSDPGNLVLVLNCSDNDEKHFIEKLSNDHVHRITFETSIKDREEMYLQGGTHFVTTRILVVDLLKNRVPVDKITGIVVVRAHTVLESCQEAFALRLYRQKNKTGFVKAFSNSVQRFTVGYGHVERVMRALFLKELYIWPRFHSTVVQSLREREPQVIELQIPISTNMAKIQTCILDLMNLTVKELKRVNKTIELQEITVENCLTKQFHKILQNQLDCIWHQLSTKSKQLVADLKTLRHLIVSLLYADPVTFYNLVSSYRTLEYAQICTWILFEQAELLFTYANTLIFSDDKELNPEFCPKWKALNEILKVEIPAEIQKTNNFENNKVLILCQDTKTCYQLNHFLTNGPQHYLFSMVLKYGITFKSINKDFKQLQELPEFKNSSAVVNRKGGNAKMSKRAKVDKEDKEEQPKTDSVDDDQDDFKDAYCLTMSQTICDSSGSKSDLDCTFEPFAEFENINLTQLCEATKANPTILIQTFRKSDSASELQKVLEEMQPNFVIMYHSDITGIRNVEMYESRRSSEIPLKVYFLIHNETVEEQSYLTSLRREKEAFEFLINTKSTMVIPEDQDGKSDNCVSLQREVTVAEVDTRQGGEATKPTKHIVIVDMREFCSELPALIHKRGIEIEPLTITVGDYILTPDICVERKSISDLIGSLISGRLYQQCTQMSRCYKKPMLLIEFDPNKTFSWQKQYMISSDGDNFEIQQKLLLLTLHFPKLKIVWSASPYASAQLFEELKTDKEQPNIEYATAIGSEQDLDLIETKYNVGVYDFVYKLPGISSKNIDRFLKQSTNMDHVIKMTENELQEVLGNSKDARTLYSIIHEEHAPKKQSDQKLGKGRAREKFKHTKK